MTNLFIVLQAFLFLCVVCTYVVAMIDKDSDYEYFKLALIFNFILYGIRFLFDNFRDFDVVFFSLKFIPLYFLSNFFLNGRLTLYRNRLLGIFLLGNIVGGILYFLETGPIAYKLPIAICSYAPGFSALLFFSYRLRNIPNFFYFSLFIIGLGINLIYATLSHNPAVDVWGWSAGILSFVAIMMGLLVKVLERKVEGDLKLQEELKLINAIYKAVIHDTSNDLNFLSLSLSRAIRQENLSYVKIAYDRLNELIKFKSEIRKQFKSHKDTYDVNTGVILKSILDRYEDSFREKKVQLVTAVPRKHSDIAIPISKESLVNSIVGNLLSNALKYSERRSKVSFSMVLDEHFIFFTVVDSGDGISPDIVESVKNFSKVRSSSGTGDELGSGMGLSILCYIVSRIGGEIEFFNRERGTKVVVKIPYTTPSLKLRTHGKDAGGDLAGVQH